MDDHALDGRAKKPRFHLTHAVFGLAFIAIGLFGVGGDPDQSSAWVWVALLAGAGIAGTVAVISSLMADRRNEP